MHYCRPTISKECFCPMPRLVTPISCFLFIAILLSSLHPTASWSQSPSADYAALERRLYFTTMNLIEREWSLNNTSRVLELLEETKDSKYRGFEWGYWNGLCHQETTSTSYHNGGGMAQMG